MKILKMLERSTLLTLIAVVMLMIMAAIVVVGTGMQSGYVWLLLAGICVTWLLISGCADCKARAGAARQRRASQQSDTVRSISEGHDILNMGYPCSLDDPPVWTHDQPPNYDIAVAVAPELLPPPSYSSVISVLRATDNNTEPMYLDDNEPPSYNSVYLNDSYEHSNDDNSSHIDADYIPDNVEADEAALYMDDESPPISIISENTYNEHIVRKIIFLDSSIIVSRG